MSFLKTQTKCYIATFQALVQLHFLLTMFQQYFLCVRGEEGKPAALGFQKGVGTGPFSAWAHNAHGQEFGSAGTSVYLAYQSPRLRVFNLAISSASGRHYVLRLVVKYLKVVGVKRWRGLKILTPQTVSTSLGYIH